MNWKKIVSAACLGALGIAAAPASHAQASSNATIIGFSYTLTDLDLNDGVSPELTLTAPNYWILTAVYPDGSGIPNPVNIIDHPGISSVDTASGSAVAIYDGVAAWSVVTVNDQAPQFAAHVINQWNFALSPNTSVTMTAYGSIHAEQAGNLMTDAYASVFAAYLATPANPYETYVDDSMYAYYGLDQGRELSVTFNSGAAELDGRLGFATTAYGQSLAPVPEPSSYAMLICGLVGLAYTKRRTKR